jgi:CBS domain-containing protein
MEHQVDQLRRGEAPDNLIDPEGLTHLSRTALKDAFRAVARIQRAVGQRLEFAEW